MKDKYAYSGGAYVTPAGVGRLSSLVQKPDGTFELTYLNGVRDYFDLQGRLTATRDPQGNRQELMYDSRGKLPLVGSSKQSLNPTLPFTVAYNYRLTRIDERAADGTLTGHYITLAYDEPTGRLTTITSNDGRSVSYEHDVQSPGSTLGNLTRVNGLEGIVSEYEYTDSNDPHNLTRDTPVVGKASVVNTYDEQDRVVHQTFGSRQLDFEYTIPLTQTKVTTTVTDATGANPYTAVEQYEFDSGGKVTKRTDALGNEFRYTLNGSKLYSKEEIWQNTAGTPGLLKTRNWAYDGAGNKLTEWVQLDSGETVTRSWTYDHNWIASEQVVSSAAPSKVFRTEYTFFYDAEGVPKNVQSKKRRKDDGSFQTTTYAYDARNRRISTTLPDGVQSFNDYTGEWITKIYFKVGGVEISQGARRFGYDARGFRTQEWDARSNLTQYGYDNLGRLTSVTNALSEKTIYSYTDVVLTQVEVGQTVADGEGQITKFLYDTRNRLVGSQRKSDAGSFVDYSTYGLDSEGNKVSITDAIGRTSVLSYDLRGQLTQVRDPANKVTQFAYDAAGNRVSIVDALGHETRFEYDDLDRRTAVVKLGASPNPRTQFTYDAAGSITSVLDPEGHTTVYVFDALSRNTSVTQPLGQVVQYIYDSRDRLDYSVTSRGQKLDYAYETWGPVKEEKQYPTTSATTPSRTITHTRDDDGNVTTVTDDGVQAGAVYTRTFDALGRVYDETVKYVPGGDRVLQHRYDRYGNRKGLTLQDGTAVSNTYTYNKLGQLASASLAGASVSVAYYANDDRQTVTLPNGVSRGYTYESNGPVDTITVSGPSGQIAQYSFDYDDALNVVSYTDADGLHSYGYDGLNRLTQVTRPAPSGLPSESYIYDKVGNRKDATVPSQWTFNSNNQITASPSLTYTFDTDGNLATRSDGATFTHDARSRLVQYVKGGTTATYLQDPSGRRVKKSVNGTATWYLWDGARLLAEYDGVGTRKQRYGYLGMDIEPTQLQDANGTYYVHADHLGAPRILTNSSAQIVWRARYQAYGTATTNNDVDGNGVSITYNQRLPGQYADAESGLSYNYLRVYDTASGRYVEPDPIGLMGGVNAYTYANENPLSYGDPLGLWTANVGVTVSLQFGPINLSYSVGAVVDGTGNVGVYANPYSGAGVGGGASVGVSVGGSNAHTIQDLNGPFAQATAAVGLGPHVAGTVYAGYSGDGSPVVGGEINVGVGIGAGGSGGGSYTIVSPVGQVPSSNRPAGVTCQ